MPLSEDEQRILRGIEEHFYEDDPDFAREVGQTSLYRHAFRNIKWGLLGFVGGAVFLVVALSTSYLLSFAGFLVIFASAVFIERNARKMGRAGLESVTKRMRAGNGLREVLGSSSEKMRERFKRDEN